MKETWRWFGPDDPVTLDNAKQAGACGIVTALHHIYDGRAWSLDDVTARKRAVEAADLSWDVCESIPVPTAIKLREGPYRREIDAWKDSLVNLARAGVSTICYNFMPVVDWTRTDLKYPLPSTGLALRFDMPSFVAYDVFVLRRPGAEADYSPEALEAARARLQRLDGEALAAIEKNVIGGMPARQAAYTREQFSQALREFASLTPQDLRANLVAFLKEIAPVAEDVGARLAIHPDDPPFSLFGLPRVVSTSADFRALFEAVESPANGMTLCSGSLGARADNDLVAMAEAFGPRIHFAHLRNVAREADGSFTEAEHLDGATDMVALVHALLAEESRRRGQGRADAQIPMRPDHGHLLADDIGKARINPGYSCVGRLKGLAELRGIMRTFAWLEQPRRANPA
ncbi:MAG TPA: mannonate dehydratase [Roseiarcus sp.]|nr:mannonate dehydratase [Roseiarcus sp.]